MAKKTCGSCRHYGRVEIIPGHSPLGCGFHSMRIERKTPACQDHEPKRKRKAKQKG